MAVAGHLRDFNKGPLVLDYGAPVTATAYRCATANDSTDRDPVAWRLDGSLDGATWALVDERASQAVPADRKTWLAAMPTLANASYPVIPGAPVIESFSAAPAAVTEGSSATLSWSVSGATGVLLLPGGAVPANGSRETTPPDTTHYTLVAGNAQGSSFATATVTVNLLPRGSISASPADAEFRTAFDGALLEGPVDASFGIIDVGHWNFEDQLRHIVIPFQLPNLGTGDASDDGAPMLSYVFNPAGVPNVPVIGAFDPTPRFVETGGSATLTWSTLGATSVSISPGVWLSLTRPWRPCGESSQARTDESARLSAPGRQIFASPCGSDVGRTMP